MNILHFFPYTVFFMNYYDGFKNCHCEKEYNHIFYVYGNRAAQKDRNIHVDEDERIQYVDFGTENLEQYVEWSDLIIVNCIPENLRIIRKLNDLLEQYDKKVILAPWGRDIYRTSDAYRRNNEQDIKELDVQKKQLLERTEYMVCAKKGRDYVKEFFGLDIETSWFNGLNTFGTFECSDRRVYGRCNIMVGHRGTVTSGHQEVLDALLPYKDRIDKLICPLSYGNEEYIIQIKDYATNLYGDKFYCLKQWMDKEEYYEYLNENVDVAIFNCNTSEGMNTILHLCRNCKKIYINAQSDTFSRLMDLNFPIRKWDKRNLDFEDLCKPLSESETEQVRLAIEKFEKECSFKKWFELFEKLEESFGNRNDS